MTAATTPSPVPMLATACEVKGLACAELPWSLPIKPGQAPRAPDLALWACPVCSFLAIHRGGEVSRRGAYLRAPRFVVGARSRVLFLVSDCSCASVDGPFHEEADAAAAALRWNDRCARTAELKADRMALAGETRAAWLAALADPLRLSLSV